MRNFTHLNVHSDHSLLKGFGTIKEYVDKAKENGQSAIALTDNNSMTGIYQFIKYCESSGIKPIPGITLNIAPNGVDFKDTFTFDENNINLIPNRGANTTLTILAKNQNGLRNLFKLIELSYEESNFFIVPRVDLDILKEYKDDLIIMSGSVESELGIRMELKQSQEFLDYIQNMKNIFGDNFFIEVNRRTINDTGIQDYLIKAADMYNVKIIYTNEVYYLNQEDSYMQELEMCLDSKARMSETSTVYGGRRPALGSRDYYLKDNQEIEKDIKSIFNERTEEIYDNIDYIVNQIDNFSLEYNQHLRPKIDIPPQFKNNIDYLKYLINQGFKKKRGNASDEIKKESIERVKMELDTIIANDFVDYFLVVADFCNWSQDNGIPLGTGRGSCAGSEIAYLLNIHKTDPLRFGLLFERFISPGRGAIFHIDYDDDTSDELVASEIRNINGENKYIHELKVNDNVDGKTIKNIKIINPGSPPDVDTDFLTEGRGKVIEYVRNKYGMENVALIITYMPFKVKNAFKDMCSINDVNFGLANKLSSAIPAKLEKGQTLEDFYLSNEGQELRNKVENLPSTLTDERVASVIYKNSSEITKEDILNTRMQYIKIDSELSETRDKVEQSIKQAGRLENRVRNTGIHACGIIISSDKLTNTIPLQITEKDGEMQATTQWTYPCCEALGLIKMDFLGLDTVDIIYNTVNFVKETKGIEIDIEKDIINSDLKDPATMKLFQDAETIGIFQFSKPGVRRLLKEVKPTEFDELAAITALYRPGPMGIGLHTDFAKRKNDESARIPVHKDFYGTKVEEILKPNLNALIFQENIMQIARQCAGFSAKEADTLRKAIGKKKIEIMNSMKDRFIEGMMNNKEDHYTKESVEYLWEAFVGFGQYAFNKCLHYDTWVYLPDFSKVNLKDLYKKYGEFPENLYILSMFPDGKVEPHKVKRISYTGKKPCYTIITKSGRKIKLTKEHRMLTNNGYGTIDDGKICVGSVLMHDSVENRISAKKSAASRRNALIACRTEASRKSASERMSQYQSKLTYEDRCKHQKEIQKNNPHRTDNWLKAGRLALKEKRNDPKYKEHFHNAHMKNINNRLENNGNIFGTKTIINGERYDSTLELCVKEYLDMRNIEYIPHKKVENPVTGKYRYCDFYIDGLYVEVDGLGRGKQWFIDNKYGDDIPFIYLTQYNYIEVIDEAIMSKHIKNGDEIVEIIEPSKNSLCNTYDIEMDLSGPCNFIANGLVSHNSHSYSYALNSYQCAYLKAHYPVEFMAATLRQRADSTEKVDEIIQEIKRLNIELRPPSINESYYRARPTKDGKAILYGISNIKGISRDLVYDIIEERKNNGLYKDFNDFLFRLGNKLTKTSLMVLSQSGCFDCLNIERKAIYENANYIIKQLSQKQKENKQLEKSLFSLMTKPQDDIMTMSINIPEGEWSLIDKLNKEKETLSSYISAHPLDTLIEKEHIDPINLNDEGSKDCIVLVSDVDIKSPDNCVLLLDNKKSQMALKMTRKDSRRIYKGMLMKQEKRLSNADSATKMNLSLEEFEKIDPLYIKSGEVGAISIKYNVISSNNYSYFTVKDFKPILLDKYGQRVHTIIIKPIQLKVIGEIRAEIEKHKGNDTVRLILPDRTYIDIYNVEFRPGTTQYDLDNISE